MPAHPHRRIRPVALTFLLAASVCQHAPAHAPASSKRTTTLVSPPPLPEPPAAPVARPESLAQGFVLVVDDASGQANESRPVYLASNLNGWRPGDPDWALTPRPDGRWEIAVTPGDAGVVMEFKFTLGSWDRVELAASRGDIPNRTLEPIDVSGLAPGERPVIELSVARFRDERGAGAAEPWEPAAVGDLRRLEVAGGGGRARAITRELLVWVPPGYDDPGNAERAYPVLYMLDAQNLFDTPPGIPGEWRVDETMTWLIDSGAVPPMIIVGVPHAGALRIEEFLPFVGIPGAEPAAGEFIEWLIADVMPRVERAYRVSTDAEDTGIAGSSLGGLVAMVAGGEHPDVFGRALIESPSLLTGEGEGPRAFAAGVRRWPGRVFIGMGGRESAPDPDAPRNRLYTAWARELNDQVERTGSDRLLMIAPEARHTESAWADRFPVAIKFLFSDRRPGRGASTPEEDL